MNIKNTISTCLGKIGGHLLQQSSSELRDIRALQLLQPYLDEYFPWSEFAIKPSGLLILINEVIIHQRTRVLEVGCGASTIVLSQVPGVEVKSLEHNTEWAKVVSGYDSVRDDTILCVPINEFNSPDSWYDKQIIEANLPPKHFNLLFVDGPEGGRCVNSRLPALRELETYMADEFTVVIDDIMRADERNMVYEYCRDYNLDACFFEYGGIAILRSKRKDPYLHVG